MHDVPAERVVVTGAQCFDQWFDRQPSLDRATFCAAVGLPDRPYLLYVCSALFQGTVNEAQFVRRWIRELRTSGHRAAGFDAGSGAAASSADERMGGRGSFRPSRTWPSGVGNPSTPMRKTATTTRSITARPSWASTRARFSKAAIVGRPVFATLLPEHHENQEGTIHFHYLMKVAGGLLNTTATLSEHFHQMNVVAHGQRAGLLAQPPVCRSVHPSPRRRCRSNTGVRQGSGTARFGDNAACPGSRSVSRCCARRWRRWRR